MIETIYHDLAEFGLPLTTPGEPAFDLRFEEIRNIPQPFEPDIDHIGDPTLADGILDQLVHNAHRIEMRGDSMRKSRGKQNG
jgi:hypothetical protein